LTPPISFVHLTSAVWQISKVLVVITDISPTFSAFGQDGTQLKKIKTTYEKNCPNTKLSFYLGTSVEQNSNLFLILFLFSTQVLIRHLWAAWDICFPAWVSTNSSSSEITVFYRV
jgi:hypothetical protein